MIPPDVVDSILRRVSLVEIMSRSVVLKKSGRNHTGLCPFHNDRRNPSLSVSEDKGLYHCFSCGASGNALTFLKEHDKLDFIESMRTLGKMAGVDIEPYLKEGGDLLPLRERFKTMHKEAQIYFTQNLYLADPLARRAVNVLRERRMDKKTVEKFGLGFGGSLRDGLFRRLQTQGFRAEEIVQSGLCGEHENSFYDRFARRITFPVWDEGGTIIAYGGRAIEDHARAKYINSPETPLFKKSSVLYGWNFAKEQAAEKGAVLIAEGYMDVIRLFQAGFDYAAAPMGTGLTEDRVAFLKNKADTLYFCFDGDAAGVKSAVRSSGLAARVGAAAKVVIFPEEDDPDTFLLAHGVDAFAALLEQAQDSESFVMNKSLPLLPDTKAFFNVIFEYALSLEGEASNPVLQTQTDAFLRRCAQEAKTGFSSVEMSFQKFKSQALRPRLEPYPPAGKTQKSEDRLLAGCLMMYPELADTVAEIVSPDDFSDAESREAFRQILLHPEKTAQEWLGQWGLSSLIEEAASFADRPDLRIVKNHALQLRIKSLGNKIELLSQILISKGEDKEILQQIQEIQKEKLDLKENFYKL